MATHLVKVYVQPRPTVNDPQGQTIGAALRALGFEGVAGVRAGKYMEVLVEAADADDAARQAREMCERLLANPVIEDYRFELEGVGE